MEWRTETEDLRATTVAFILGVRNKNFDSGRDVLDGVTTAPGYHGHNVAYQPKIMPGMAGTERFQQLCSLEYLQMYFEQVLADKTINLSKPSMNGANQPNLNAVIASLDPISKSTGPVGEHLAAVAYAENAGLNVDDVGNPALSNNNTLLNLDDIAKKSGLVGSDAQNGEESYQGIFARDFGPFLKGKGTATQLVHCTEGNLPSKYGTGTVMAQPFSVSRNAGDDLAFSVLDTLLMDSGFTDWRPDGIVLSKGVNDPSDRLSDEYLEARDGQLYNIRVQGPAIATSWTGERSLETLPLDKVFIVLVADCWFNTGDDNDELSAADKLLLEEGGLHREDARKAYNELREREFAKGLNEYTFMQNQAEAYNGKTENTVLANFRLQVSTSSQMINHSTYSKKGNSSATKNGYKRARLEGMSRMGLKLSNQVGEYIVGGWQMGQVLDTSASRAAMPQGANIGVRNAPNSAALNVNVNVSWYTADRMCRSFNNAEGTVRTRFDGRSGGPINPVNMQETKKGFMAAGDRDEFQAMLLALGELQCSGWLSAVISEVQLLRNQGLRVVMRIDPKDLGRALSVENWAKLHTANFQAEALEVSEVPKWVLVDAVSELPRSNLACAKALIEMLLLLLNKIKKVPPDDLFGCHLMGDLFDRAQELCFLKTMHNIKHQGPMPASINEAQVESLMEMAEAWHADDVPKPRFDPDDFPALGSSPHGSPVHVAGRTRYSEGVAIVSVSQILGKEELYTPFVAKINIDDANNLWAVAWMAGRPRENIWLSGTSANDIRHPMAALSI